jgi:Uma2 family endonuclease
MQNPGYPLEVHPDERKRLGLDHRDEVWDGEVHMVPPSSARNQRLASRLILALHPIVERRRLEILPEVGVRDTAKAWSDFRVPDLTIVDPRQVSDAAVEGSAEVIIEILSPNDESRAKFPFYARRRVREIWLIEPISRTIEIFALREDKYDITTRSTLGIEIVTVDGKLEIRDGEYVAVI